MTVPIKTVNSKNMSYIRFFFFEEITYGTLPRLIDNAIRHFTGMLLKPIMHAKKGKEERNVLF